MNRTATLILSLAAIMLAGAAEAQNSTQNSNVNLNRAQNTVNNISQPTPPTVSTGTASGVVGTPASQFHPPAANTVRTTPPPPPSH
jgi:hypothetical protein